MCLRKWSMGYKESKIWGDKSRKGMSRMLRITISRQSLRVI